MKVVIVDTCEYYDRCLYLVELPEGLSLEAMQALLDLKEGPARPAPRAGSSEWATYRDGLHKIVGVGDIEWLGGADSHYAPIEFRNFVEGLGNRQALWVTEHREEGRQLAMKLPPELQDLLTVLLVHGTSEVTGEHLRGKSGV